MKTMTKRIASVALAVMMAVVVLASALPAKAFAAAPTGTLIITSSNKEFNGKTVTAWQMFSATATADGANASYTLNAEWEAFFKNGKLDGFTATDKTGTELSDAAVDYVTKLGKKDDPDVITFAKKAADWAKKQQSLTKSEVVAEASGDQFVATFSGLAYGYYVVSPKGGSTDVNTQRGTDAILANVVKDTQDVVLKSEYPTVEKTLEDGQNHADAQIGDSLNFVLKSKVPDMAEYKNGYTFNFIDTLSKGLTLNVDSIEVTIGDATVLAKDTDYTVATTGGSGANTTLTIAMKDFKTLHGGKAGQTIKVTYTATINEHAEVGKDDAGNSVKLEYSNDPNTTSKGESLPDETHGYTFGFDLHKTDANGGAALADAEFQLQKKPDGTPVKLIVENAGNDTDPAIVRPATREEIDAPQSKAVETVTTPKSGNITFKGLDAAGYQLVEIKAPDGYNKLNAPVDVTIEAKYDQGGVLESWTVGGKTGPSVTIDVQNNKGALLPETGGMGTVIFTVAGIAIIAGAIAWKRSRRAGNDA